MFVALLGMVSSVALAQGGSGTPASEMVDGPSGQPMVTPELGGVLRLRGQWIEGGTLGNGTSGLPASLSSDGGIGAGDRLRQADVRLRLRPALSLGSYARIDSLVDVAGRTVFGSDPRLDDVAGHTWGFEGNGPVRDAFAVRRLWATFDVFGIGTFEVGRTPDHFGLGILRNDGRDLRADWQSDVDRVRIGAELFGLRVRLSRDTMATLPMVAKGLAADDPHYALADSTDVIRWLAEVETATPSSEPGLHWALAVGYQDQAVGLELEHSDNPLAKLQSDCLQRGTCVTLVTRDATMIMPQAFVSWRADRPWGQLRLQAEGAARVGTIANTDSLASTDTSKILVAGAAVGRAELLWAQGRAKLDAGYVSGEGAGGFGVLDRQNLTAATPSGEVHRKLLTGLPLHRGFLIDGLLYREVIGAVANSAYLRPAYRRTFFGEVPDLHGDAPGVGLDVEFSLLAAMAARNGSTPGRTWPLGLEPELRIDARFGRAGAAILQGSWLLPGSAFDAGQGGKAASSAMRISFDWLTTF